MNVGNRHEGVQRDGERIYDRSLQAIMGAIRRRRRQPLTGQWFNIIEAAGHRFLQGPINRDVKDREEAGKLAYISHRVHPEDIAGFWPETAGRLLTVAEENFLVAYISALDGRDVELIVPLRNIARPVRWVSFEDSREYSIYADHIYPEVLKIMSKLSCRRLLDVGCGAGNLLAAIRQICPQVDFAGIDISPDNVEATKDRGFTHIHEGEAGKLDEFFPPETTFDVIIFCGVLNRQIMDGDSAMMILKKSLSLLERGGHIVITGYSSCHFTASDLTRMGLTVLKKSIPQNIFKDYNEFHLRQFYLARKN